ncbi:hypothetical protein B0H14DRAFT_2360895, partial [Mycena olivaceomarginata]
KKRWTLKELLGLGFQLVRWDGYKPHPIVDCHGRIVAVLAGQPCDPKYAASTRAVYQAMCNERTSAGFTAQSSSHRRGPFPAVNCGITYRKGQRVPTRMNNGVHAWLIERLL